MQKFRLWALMVLMVTALSACQTTKSQNNHGSGPITLAPNISNAYQNYLEQVDPLAFAVTPDGKYSGYYFCNIKGECVFADAKTEAIKYCASNAPSNSGACKIYAVGKNVVWQGGASSLTISNVLPSETAPFSPPPRRPGWKRFAGKGPLDMSPKVQRDFQGYRKLSHPLSFAVSANGKTSGWYYCPGEEKCDTNDVHLKALEFCNNSAPRGGKTCKLYAMGTDVIWDVQKLSPSDQPDFAGLAGKGPIKMTREVNSAFYKYLKMRVPTAFALSPKGDHAGWADCKKPGTCTKIRAAREAIESCNMFTPPIDGSCKLYASGKDVVWEMVKRPSVSQFDFTGLEGQGPINLNQSVNAAYVKYLAMKAPATFAVSPKGDHAGWVDCEKPGSCMNINPALEAIKVCSKYTPRIDGRCKLFAVKRKVVWKEAPVDVSAYSGSGPLLISRNVDKAYQQYVKRSHPLAFSISLDGEFSGRFFCNAKGACPEKVAIVKAIESCNARIKPGGSPCKLYALKKKVVWQGPVAVLPGIQADDSLRAALPEPPRLALVADAPPPQLAPAASALPKKIPQPRSSKAFKALEDEINRVRSKR